MKVLSDESIRECFNFITEYYPIRHEVKISVAMSINDREWQRIFTWILIWTSKLQEWVKDKKKREELINLGIIKEGDVFEHETHIRKEAKIGPREEWKKTSGWFCDSSAIKIYLAMDERNRHILERPFMEVLKDSKWFIFLRDTKDHFFNLVNLFHELLHIIEIEGHYPIFSGSSKKAEIRDTKEIVIPLTKEFLRSHKSPLPF